ncbi:MAG: PD-(D/E)XK nuclease family protein [Flavobacteriales bacterium]|nr:PD-(D/E)XK nuclease family protein [Flavobacteriales bacterium]
METFLSAFTGMRTMSQEEALVLLYRSHVDLLKGDAGSFSDMLQWSPTALRDMNDVDHHLLDLQALYRDLRQIEELDAWSFRGTELSPGQSLANSHWKHHGALHAALTKRGCSQGAGIPGYVARLAAEQVVRPEHAVAWELIYFVGLNQLTPAENKVLSTLLDRKRAEVAWDVDRYFLDDPQQDTGRTLGPLIDRHGEGRIPLGDTLRKSPPTVRAVGAPDPLSAIQWLTEQLRGYASEERDRTCILLADPALLEPLMLLLPEAVSPVNITMGLALRDLPAADLIDATLAVIAATGKDLTTPVNLLRELLEHAYWTGTHDGLRAMRVRLMKARGSRIRLSDLFGEVLFMEDAVIHALHRALVANEASKPTLRERIAAVLGAAAILRRERFVQEQLFQCARVLERMERLMSGIDERPDPRSYRDMVRRLLAQARIDHFGEPLKGLQIMGMLESRATDHERVLVLGANEGHLPPDLNELSFIPFDVRRAYGLPLPRDREAEAAYPFQRLLHHCQELTLVHVDDGEGGNPVSRYLLQLELELLADQDDPVRRSVRPAVPSKQAFFPGIKRSPELIQELTELAHKGYSPSALNTFLNCPLDYYHRYVLRIKVDDPPAPGSLGSDELGSLVHQAMEHGYKPFLGRMIDPGRLLERAPDIMEHIGKGARSILGPELEGPALLQVSMAQRAVRRFIEAECTLLRSTRPLELLALEVPVEVSSGIMIGDHPVRFKGRLDRVDRHGSIVRVADLKTGGCDPRELKLGSLRPEEVIKRGEKARQLLLYAYMYLIAHPELDRITAAILGMRGAQGAEGALLEVSGDPLIRRDMIPDIEHALAVIIDRILDPAGPALVHGPTSRYCRSCAGADLL